MEGGDLRDALGDDDTGELDWYNGGASLLMDIARGLHFLHINKVMTARTMFTDATYHACRRSCTDIGTLV